MYAMTCAEKIRAIYATQAQEDSTMSVARAIVAHRQVCAVCRKKES